MKSTFIFALALASSGLAQSDPRPIELDRKPELFPLSVNGLRALNRGPAGGSGGFLGRPHVNFTVKRLPAGTIPYGCDVANYHMGQSTPDACPVGNIEAYDIEYSDVCLFLVLPAAPD